MKAAKTRALNAKHAGTRKHAATAKHAPAAHKKTATAARQTARRAALSPKAAKARALGGVACCSAEAVAASLRLAGGTVGDADVLALYRHTADSPGAGASIWRTLEAALAFGLAGVRPVSFGLLDDPALRAEAFHDGVAHAGLPFDAGSQDRPVGEDGPDIHGGPVVSAIAEAGATLDFVHGASVILGLDLPEGPHAVTLDPSGAVWSWGSLYEMTPEAAVEEAWAVVWP